MGHFWKKRKHQLQEKQQQFLSQYRFYFNLIASFIPLKNKQIPLISTELQKTYVRGNDCKTQEL